MARQPGGLVQVDHDRRASSQLVAPAATLDHIRTQHAPQAAHQRGHMLRRLSGRAPGSQHLGDPVHGHQPRPLDGKQFQQSAGLAAAQVAVGEPDTIADHTEYTRQVQLQLRGNTSSTEQLPAHVPFVLAFIDAGKRPMAP